MQRMTDREFADSLLFEWYLWSKPWRPNLGAPKAVSCCSLFTTSKQYDDPEELLDDKVYQNQMSTVDFCMGTIAVNMQQAIGTEMKNREVKAKVWRDQGGQTYQVALDLILPVMRTKGLFD